MQAPAPLAQIVAAVDAAQHEHGHGIGIGLSDRRASVHHAGSGNEDTDPRFAGRASVSVRHEPCALFMAHADMANAAAGEPLVEVQGMHARNPEHGVDTVGFQKGDGRLAAGFVQGHGMVLHLGGD